MIESDSDLVLEWYLDLEIRLTDLLAVVPYSSNTDETFLPSVSSIVLEGASLLDTVLRSEYAGSKKRKKLTFPDYAEHYDPIFQCRARHTVLFVHPARYVSPFAGWVDSNGNYLPLEWWANYNKLKHDRIKHYSLSTLGTVINVVAALHQTIALLPCFTTCLFRRNMINCGTFNPAYVIDIINGNSRGHSVAGVVCAFESKLFCSSSSIELFPDDIARIQPWRYNPESQLFRHLSYIER